MSSSTANRDKRFSTWPRPQSPSFFSSSRNEFVSLTTWQKETEVLRACVNRWPCLVPLRVALVTVSQSVFQSWSTANTYEQKRKSVIEMIRNASKTKLSPNMLHSYLLIQYNDHTMRKSKHLVLRVKQSRGVGRSEFKFPTLATNWSWNIVVPTSTPQRRSNRLDL